MLLWQELDTAAMQLLTFISAGESISSKTEDYNGNQMQSVDKLNSGIEG